MGKVVISLLLGQGDHQERMDVCQEIYLPDFGIDVCLFSVLAFSPSVLKKVAFKGS